MKRYKRASALLMTLMMLMTMCIIPARADYQSNSNFFQWVAQTTGGIPQHILGYLSGPVAEVCPESDDAKHHAASCVWDGVAGHFICTCDYCGDTFIATKTEVSSAYQTSIHDLPATTYKSNGGLIWHVSNRDISSEQPYQYVVGAYPVDDDHMQFLEPNWIWEISATDIANSFSVTASTKDGTPLASVIGYTGTVKIVVPIDGVYTEIEPLHISSTEIEEPISVSTRGGTKLSGDIISYSQKNRNIGQKRAYSYSIVYPIYEIEPTSYNNEATGGINYSVEYRPTSITGDYSVVGDNNEVFVHDETIFNEDNSTFYNPITGDTTTMESWTYDYSTRTYNMVDENDNSTTLTYGDDAIVINDGGNTFNLYYGDVRQTTGGGDSGDNTGGGNGSGTSYDTGIFGQIGTLLGALISGLLSGITALLSAILGALTSLVETIGDGFANIVQAILGWFAELPALFSGFLEFLGAVFSFLPSQIISMLSFGIAAVVFIGIIKAIRR